MSALLILLVVLFQTPAAPDPHNGRFTIGLGRRCASCHDPANPRAEDTYRAAQSMAKMVDDLNKGPLQPYGRIDCVSCHRGGGPQHLLAFPRPLNRAVVARAVEAWPGDSRATPDVRRAMSTYTVSLGVGCQYCHSPQNWKTETAAMKRARPMIALMDTFPKYFDFARAAAFTCDTCHQGAVRIPSK
jgi:hypothetical protein